MNFRVFLSNRMTLADNTMYLQLNLEAEDAAAQQPEDELNYNAN